MVNISESFLDRVESADEHIEGSLHFCYIVFAFKHLLLSHYSFISDYVTYLFLHVDYFFLRAHNVLISYLKFFSFLFFFFVIPRSKACVNLVLLNDLLFRLCVLFCFVFSWPFSMHYDFFVETKHRHVVSDTDENRLYVK